MFDLTASLGLDKVEADPNNIPDGRYDGKVLKSEYVLSKDKDKISHVVTYQVTDGQYKGAQRQQWYNLGDNCKNAQGGTPENLSDVAAFNPTMTEQNKQWYKKLFVDLGIPEEVINTPGGAKPEMLVNKLVTFGVKRNQGYVNVNFVELRTDAPVVDMGAGAFGSAPVSLEQPQTPTSNPFAGSESGLPQF